MKAENVSSDRAKVLYDWILPDESSDVPGNEIANALSSFKLVFNSLKDVSSHFVDNDLNRLASKSMAGVSRNDLGRTFNGDDSVVVLDSSSMKNWTVFFDIFNECSIPTSLEPQEKRLPARNKSKILLSNKKKLSDPNGFIIGLNGANSLFYEFTDKSTGRKNIKTFNNPIQKNSIVSVSRSNDINTLSLEVFDPDLKKTLSKTFEANEKKNNNEWIIGGVEEAIINNIEYEMFTGIINHFLLIDGSTTSRQINRICQSFFMIDFKGEHYEKIPTQFTKSGSYVETTAPDGVEITGYTYQPKAVTLDSGQSVAHEEKVPTYETKYKTVTQYVEGEGSFTKDVLTLVPELITFNDFVMKDYLGTCLTLGSSVWGVPITDLATSDITEIYSHANEIPPDNRETVWSAPDNVGRAATFVSSGKSFRLEQSYPDETNINIYLNGKLKENGKDYEISNGKIVTSLGESFSHLDKMTYDVIEGNDPKFYDFEGYSGDLWLYGENGKDVYLDGIKLVYLKDYYDNENFLVITGLTLSAGRLSLITRSALEMGYGNGKYTYCQDFNILLEQVWLNGIRLIKNVDYSIICECDLNNSSDSAKQKTTLFYNNEETFFNI